MLSANNTQHHSSVASVALLTIVLVVTAQIWTWAQCRPDASAWLESLAGIENSDLALDKKIASLSILKENYQSCVPKKDSVYARIVHRLGDYYRIHGDFETGIKLTAEAASVNSQPSGGQPSYLAHSYYNLGLYHHLLGLTDIAHLYYDSCVTIGYQFPEKLFIALMALEKKAFLYFQAGDYEKSIITSDQGRLLAQNQNLPDYEALLLIQKAQSESEINRIGQAEQNISRAIEILDKNNITDYLPNAYSVYAHVLSRRKLFNEATSYYKKAARSNLHQNNQEQAARDLHDLGFLYDKELNDPERSIAYYTEALELLSDYNGPALLPATYNNLGQVYWRQNDFHKALEYYQKGLESLITDFAGSDIRNNPTSAQLQGVIN
jgi:tetratricopeptide (TPR) repeat protein